MKKGRIRQDTSFSMPELVGRRVEKVLGVVRREAPNSQPIVVNMRLDDGTWHRYFLDAGLAFWEQWVELVDDDLEDEVRCVDYGRDYALVGEIIRSVESRASGPQELAELTIAFTSGRFLQLSFSDLTD